MYTVYTVCIHVYDKMLQKLEPENGTINKNVH